MSRLLSKQNIIGVCTALALSAMVVSSIVIPSTATAGLFPEAANFLILSAEKSNGQVIVNLGVDLENGGTLTKSLRLPLRSLDTHLDLEIGEIVFTKLRSQELQQNVIRELKELSDLKLGKYRLEVIALTQNLVSVLNQVNSKQYEKPHNNNFAPKIIETLKSINDLVERNPLLKTDALKVYSFALSGLYNCVLLKRYLSQSDSAAPEVDFMRVGPRTDHYSTHTVLSHNDILENFEIFWLGVLENVTEENVPKCFKSMSALPGKAWNPDEVQEKILVNGMGLSEFLKTIQ